MREDSNRMTRPFTIQALLRKPGLMDCWWVCMLWQMSRGQRGPAERSIVLRWPVKNSIIPPSHRRRAPFLPLRQATAEQWKNIIATNWPRALIQSRACTETTSHRHLWLSAKSLRRWCGSQFGGISVSASARVSVGSQSRDRVSKRGSSPRGRSFDSVPNAITVLIYMISCRQTCAADSRWNKKTRSDTDADWIPYITPSIRHRSKQWDSRLQWAPRGADKKPSNTSASQTGKASKDKMARKHFDFWSIQKRSADMERWSSGRGLH